MVSKKSSTSLLNKITAFLAGFLGSLMTFIILLKASSSYLGILLGIIFSGGLGYYLLKKQQRYKIVAYGVLASAIFIVIASIVIWIFVYSAFQGIAA